MLCVLNNKCTKQPKNGFYMKLPMSESNKRCFKKHQTNVVIIWIKTDNNLDLIFTLLQPYCTALTLCESLNTETNNDANITISSFCFTFVHYCVPLIKMYSYKHHIDST